MKLMISLYLDDVDTLDDVDIDDDVETELDVDTLEKNSGRLSLHTSEVFFSDYKSCLKNNKINNILTSYSWVLE